MKNSITGNNLAFKIVFIALSLLCLTPIIDPPLALFLGLVVSQTMGHPFIKYNGKITKKLLQYSVVGLGFGLNVFEAAKAGKEGLLFTVSTIGITLIVGIIIGKVLKVNKNVALLIAGGTAICGGSAIAAIAPVIESKEEEISVSLGTIFILNSVALFLFPLLGSLLHLTQQQFGMWSAIAIHDTSSVVGAASKFGPEALKIATTVKLERALWIIPVTLLMAFLTRSKNKKIQIPYFIFFFIGAMILNTYLTPIISMGTQITSVIVLLSKKGLTLTLFFIGAGLSRKALKEVGIKPLLLGVMLWVVIGTISLLVIQQTL